MPSTSVGEALAARLAPTLDLLGPYPHAAVTPSATTSAAPKQGTRMLKCECPACGYTVRTTRKWLDLGEPLCPVHERPMPEAV